MKRIDEALEQLKRHAMRAADHSYSPYSHFRVGAAVTGRGGQVHVGCNVENASYGLTQCAERAALTAAVAGGESPGTLRSLVLYTPGESAHAPCGACRQVMHELMAPDSLVVSCCDTDEVRAWEPSDYLPDPFRAEVLLGRDSTRR
jgi:cytidine deaminase